MDRLGRYSIYTQTSNVNVKLEREKSNKRVSIVSTLYSIPAWTRRERVTQIYGMWTWNASERETDRYM